MFDQEPAGGDGSDDLNGSQRRRSETRAEWLEREIVPHAAMVRRIFSRKYPSIDLNDMMQAAYLKLMTTEQVTHVEDSAKYLYRAAESVIWDQSRRALVRKTHGPDSMDIERLESVAADEPAADRIIDSRWALERAYAELRKLPAREQLVFKLRFFDELPVRVVAERIGKSIRTVEKDYMNARRSLAAAARWFDTDVAGEGR